MIFEVDMGVEVDSVEGEGEGEGDGVYSTLLCSALLCSALLCSVVQCTNPEMSCTGIRDKWS